MQKSNLIKKLVVITNIVWLISFILILIFQTKFTYSLYWIIVPLIIIFSVLFIHEIDKGKIDTDIDKSSLIKRAYNDSTTILIVAYVLAYLIIDFTDLNSLAEKVNSLEQRINRLENLVNNGGYSTNYNSTNYQMM